MAPPVYYKGMSKRRYTHPALQVTAHDMATTRPLDQMDDEQLDIHFWGPLVDPGPRPANAFRLPSRTAESA